MTENISAAEVTFKFKDLILKPKSLLDIKYYLRNAK